MSQPDLNKLDPEQLRSFAASLLAHLAEQSEALTAHRDHAERVEQRCHCLQTLNDKLTLEMSVLKRHRFGKHSEQINLLQRSLLDDI